MNFSRTTAISLRVSPLSSSSPSFIRASMIFCTIARIFGAVGPSSERTAASAESASMMSAVSFELGRGPG